MAARTVKKVNLKAATAASVKAVLGAKPQLRPGILVGFWADRESLAKLKLTPAAAAKQVALQVSKTSGIKVTAGVEAAGRGVLVGYYPPAIMKK